ncbi:MAG: methyltransferase domain-containing protein [Dehalococcoidaceae bacterium]|nr:methyltransferase domain-containing protein [Dehalococcoidaceae bacterium]
MPVFPAGLTCYNIHVMLNYAGTVDRFLAGLRRELPGWAGMHPGQRVLDVCCGTGAQVMVYAAFGLEATGIDNNPDMLALASIHSGENGSAALVEGDAECLPFDSGIFDWASIQFALHDKSSAQRLVIIREMRRVVKPGGHLLFTEFAVPLPLNFMGVSIKLIERMAGGEHFAGFKDFMSNGGLSPLLEKTGLKASYIRVFKQKAIMVIKAGNNHS